MSDATYIVLPPPPKKRRSFLRGWKGAIFILFALAAVLAGCFSWWLSQGKVSSSFARVDGVVYTVGAETPAKVAQILVQTGESVLAGQPLAKLELATGAIDAQFTSPAPDIYGIGDISDRINATKSAEDKMSFRLAQARAEEEKRRAIHQARVTEHVSALLALRATDRYNPEAWNMANRMEMTAKQRMDAALDDFERVSKARAAIETELLRIRSELYRKKQRGSRQPTKAPEKTAPPPPPELGFLYSPAAGKILSINAAVGQQAQPWQTLFMVLPAGVSSENWIQAWFPLSSQNMLKLGQKAMVKYGDLHIIGHVAAISTEAQYMPDANGQIHEGANQYLAVRIQADKPEELSRLLPGTKVECQIQTRYIVGENLF